MSERSYSGPPLDGTEQYVTERPELDGADSEIVYATDPETPGKEITQILDADLNEKQEAIARELYYADEYDREKIAARVEEIYGFEISEAYVSLVKNEYPDELGFGDDEDAGDDGNAPEYSEMEHPWRDEEVVRHLYVDKGMGTEAIGDELGCTGATVGNWLDEHEIEKRPPGDPNGETPWRDRETLHDLYVEQGLSMADVAEELGCTDATVANWIAKHDIPVESRGTPKLDDAEWLRRKYHDEGKSAEEIAVALDLAPSSRSSVLRALENHGIARRDYSDAQRDDPPALDPEEEADGETDEIHEHVRETAEVTGADPETVAKEWDAVSEMTETDTGEMDTLADRMDAPESDTEAKTPEEVAAIDGGDADDIEAAYSAVNVNNADEEQDDGNAPDPDLEELETSVRVLKRLVARDVVDGVDALEEAELLIQEVGADE